jgi:hypothetical protein
LLELAENVNNGKNGIPLYCFILKKNASQDILDNRCSIFYGVRFFIVQGSPNFNKIYLAYIMYKELGSEFSGYFL